MSVSLRTGEAVLVERLHLAETPLTRMRGLLGKPPPAAGEGLLLDPCRAVHTCGMRYPLDLVFIDRDWRVCRVFRDVRPWQLRCGPRGAVRVLEVRSGWMDGSLCPIGATVSLSGR